MRTTGARRGDRNNKGGVMEVSILKGILEKHLKWLRDDPQGERADLYGANFNGGGAVFINIGVTGGK
jgi:hypothetical protein